MPAGELVTVPAPSPFLPTLSTKLPTSNVAVTERAWSMVTTQGSVPVQAPPQAPKTEPTAGVAVSVTSVLYSYVSLQSEPQSIPAGELATEPLPGPARFTVSSNVATEKVAVTERAWSMVTLQGSVPVQSPLQPSNTEPVAGVAVSVTTVL